MLWPGGPLLPLVDGRHGVLNTLHPPHLPLIVIAGALQAAGQSQAAAVWPLALWPYVAPAWAVVAPRFAQVLWVGAWRHVPRPMLCTAPSSVFMWDTLPTD